MNYQLLFIIALLYVSTMAFGFFFLRPRKEKEQLVPSNSYPELMGILEATIQREIEYKHNMDYKLKDIRIIYDFQKDLKELTDKVMNSLAPSFLEELAFYHSRKYIITHVTRYIQNFLIEYTRQNKIKTK